jgi:hypothetical protein
MVRSGLRRFKTKKKHHQLSLNLVFQLQPGLHRSLWFLECIILDASQNNLPFRLNPDFERCDAVGVFGSGVAPEGFQLWAQKSSAILETWYPSLSCNWRLFAAHNKFIFVRILYMQPAQENKETKKNNVLETTLSRAIFRQFVSQKKGRSLVSNKNQTCVPRWTCISLKPHLYLAGSTWNVARNIQMIQSLSRPTSLWHSLAIYTPSTSLPFVSSCCQLFPTLFSTSQLVLALSCLLDISRSLLAISLHFVGWWHIKNI